ncbi:MAG: hypothetical protein AAF492_14635, partial [Verrucomicrobiota bacterium]
TESGFPNASEISSADVEARDRERRQMALPSDSILKRQFLDHLFKHGKDSEEFLARLSEWHYLDMLKDDRIFSSFTPGEMVEQPSPKKGSRGYLFTWGCYDHKTNRPYIHLMTFEQDATEPPLHGTGFVCRDFMNVIESEGSRVPDVGVLALAIDDALETVHPKILKRICVGPLYSKLLLKHREPNPDDPREAPVREVLERYARNDTDYMLFLSDEVVFSKRQKVTKSILSSKSKVREIFSIPETDPQCYARRASVIHNYVLMPHLLLQHLDARTRQTIPGLRHCKKLTYDEQGEVHGA